MATCLKQVIYGGNVFMSPDSSVSVDQCAFLVVDSSDYSQMVFSAENFETAFVGGLGLFATGLAVGLVISTVRKMRI